MNKLTKELLNYIGLDEEDLESKIDDVTELNNSTYFCYDGCCSSAGIFELTKENLRNQIRPSESVYRGRLQYLRRQIGKKFKDFTLEDWLKLLELHNNRPSRSLCGSLFSCGGDQSDDWEIVEIDGKKYLKYYSEC